MRGPFLQGTLLVVALVAALATWNSPGRAPAETTVTVWDRSERDVVGVLYTVGDARLEIERKGTGEDAYLWGRQLAPVSAATLEAAGMDAVAAAAAALQSATQTEEYPVGDQGSEVFARLARLQALRDIGPADPATLADFGLAATDAAMTIRFSDGTVRTLAIGEAAAGGEARYALDVDSARVYALPTDLFTGFETGAGAFRLSAYLAFRSDDVGSVSVRAAGATRTMHRRMIDSPPRPVWIPREGEQHDVAFGIFIDQFEQLWVVRYAPEVSEMSLEPIVRVEYTDARGRDLGFLEIMRTRGTAEPSYYMRTPRTIVFGEIYAPQAGRIEADVANQIRAVPPAGVRG